MKTATLMMILISRVTATQWVYRCCTLWIVSLTLKLFRVFVSRDGTVLLASHFVHSRTLAENLADLPGLKEGQDIIMPLSNPIKATGHLQVGRGFGGGGGGGGDGVGIATTSRAVVFVVDVSSIRWSWF